MPLPYYSSDNFRDALLKLLPPGPLWNRSADSVIGRLFHILGKVFQRNNARAVGLIADLFPGTTDSFLTEWEKTLGLPDRCSAALRTQEQRRTAIIAKLTDEGGSSVPYYQTLAAHCGTPITIDEYAPARAGILRAGNPCFGENWAFAWRVTLPQTMITSFRAHHSAAGEPLHVWQRGYLECAIAARTPAHTRVLFAYRTSATLKSGD